MTGIGFKIVSTATGRHANERNGMMAILIFIRIRIGVTAVMILIRIRQMNSNQFRHRDRWLAEKGLMWPAEVGLDGPDVAGCFDGVGCEAVIEPAQRRCI